MSKLSPCRMFTRCALALWLGLLAILITENRSNTLPSGNLPSLIGSTASVSWVEGTTVHLTSAVQVTAGAPEPTPEFGDTRRFDIESDTIEFSVTEPTHYYFYGGFAGFRIHGLNWPGFPGARIDSIAVELINPQSIQRNPEVDAQYYVEPYHTGMVTFGDNWVQFPIAGYSIAPDFRLRIKLNLVPETRTPQTITFNPIPSKTTADQPFALEASASSGLPVSFTLVSGPATLEAGILTLTGSGTVVIKASQPGNNQFLAAPEIEQTFTVQPFPSLIGSTASIAWVENTTLHLTSVVQVTAGAPEPTPEFGDTRRFDIESDTIEFSVTELTHYYFYGGFAGFRIHGLNWPGFPGTRIGSIDVQLINPQSIQRNPDVDAQYYVEPYHTGMVTFGDNWVQFPIAGYSIAPDFRLRIKLNIIPGTQIPQTITFNSIPPKITTDQPFALEATASSGLPVGFTLVSGPATLDAGIVTLTGAGTVVIKASQPGNNNFLAAPEIEQSIVVKLPGPTISTPPQGQSFALNGSAVLRVEATGRNLTYQWQFNGENIPGETAAELHLDELTLGDAGTYRVVVTSDGISATSDPANLTFFGDLKFYAGTTLAGPVGQKFRVEYADDINGQLGDWKILAEVTLPASPYLVVDPTSPGKAKRFYRATVLP